MKKRISGILFPVAVILGLGASTAGTGRGSSGAAHVPSPAIISDTVIYPQAGYKLRRTLSLEQISIADTGRAAAADTLSDTPDTVRRLSPRDSLKATLDSTLWDRLDSIYIADSIARAKEEFDRWYASLSKQERKRYDSEQQARLKMARADSLRKVREERQNIRDSLIEVTPRILETYAVPDSMQYKRLLTWRLDRDFGHLRTFSYDTSYNYRFHDYPFRRNDVNAAWLGVAGAPLQYYDFFKRESAEGVEFYKALESWSYSPGTVPHFNTKTPYTELAYWGTLFGNRAKESDNIRLFTTQNVTPAFNFTLAYERYGGGGMLENEETSNSTSRAQINYLGRKYTMHAGVIRNSISREENGGIVDLSMVRDTSVNSRDLKVALLDAKSKTKKTSFYLDQQMRIPFNFIERIKARRDSSYVFNPDSLQRDMASAFIGHSLEYSDYTRKYTDRIGNEAGKAFYRDVFNHGIASADSMRTGILDNKVYLRLQPWASDAVISKLDVGAGDVLKTYFDSTSLRPATHRENSLYIYAGAEGQFRGNVFWDARGRYILLGHDFGDFSLSANARLDIYPFRRARKSPASLKASFETSLLEPNFYQQHINANHFRWDNDFAKTSTTRIQGEIDIPHWRFNARAGYALLGNQIYYDELGTIRQKGDIMSVLSAYARKEFVFGPLHLDNRALFQLSSDRAVVPVPAMALNLRYFVQFSAQKDESGKRDILTMQIGADAYYNSKWNTPGYNPNLGVFYNQNTNQYNNGPYFDIFINMQWKQACIFIKYQNAGGGWPMRRSDYFSADRYVITSNGTDGLKFGIFWPFYAQPRGQAPAVGR